MSSRLRIVLWAPRIAGNVGSIARTALAAGAELHLVRPFGFQWDPQKIRRASAGHLVALEPQIYRDAEDFWERFPFEDSTQFLYATKFGGTSFVNLQVKNDVVLFFGNEEQSIAEDFWEKSSVREQIVACRIPTVSVRCLNLSVAVGIFSFEVIRQWGGLLEETEFVRMGERT